MLGGYLLIFSIQVWCISKDRGLLVNLYVTLHRISSIMVMTRARYFNTVDKRNFLNTITPFHYPRLLKFSFVPCTL